jgi:hypothetical protein
MTTHSVSLTSGSESTPGVPVQSSLYPEILVQLKKLPLFQQLDDSELTTICKYFHETRFNRETVIFYERDTSTRIYVSSW